MRYMAVLIALFLGPAATVAQAQVNLGLLVGSRNENSSEDRPPAGGLTVDFGRCAWVVRPELGMLTAVDVFGGNETEISLGLLHSWAPRRVRLNLGAGATVLSTDFGFNDGSTTAAYLHGGVEWLRAERSSLGLDLRYVADSEITVEGESFDIGYLQLAFRMTWEL